jgi:hypothetical protein
MARSHPCLQPASPEAPRLAQVRLAETPPCVEQLNNRQCEKSASKLGRLLEVPAGGGNCR